MKKIEPLTLDMIVAAKGEKTSGIFNVNGRNLYVETYGCIDRPAIAFLHGGPGTSCMEQAEMAALLGKHYFVVSFDQFGVFRSGEFLPGEHFGMKEHIDQMEDLRKALGLKSWSLLGHSYGGMLVGFYTYHYPSSIDVAMFENPSWYFVRGIKNITQMYLDKYYIYHPDEKDGIAAAQYVLNKDYTGCEEEGMWDILKAQKYVKDKKITYYMHSIEPHIYFDIMEREFEELEMTDADIKKMDEMELLHLQKLNEGGEINADHFPEIAAIKNPCLLLSGRYDPICTEAERDFFRQNVENGEIVIFEHSAHHPRLEDKEQYLAAVVDFMERHVR